MFTFAREWGLTDKANPRWLAKARQKSDCAFNCTQAIPRRTWCIFINGLLDRRAEAGVKTSILLTNQAGLRMSHSMLRYRWDEARESAATKAAADGDTELAVTIRKFQLRDILPKPGSEIKDIKDASRLLGHSTEAARRAR